VREGCSGARRGDGTDWTCLIRSPLLCLMLCTLAALLARPCASYRRSNLSRKILDRFEFRVRRARPALAVSADRLCSLSSCLPSVLVLPFCALLLTAGTSKSLRRFRGPFLFALLVHDNCSPGLVTPVCLVRAFRWPRVSAVVLPASCDGCSCFLFYIFSYCALSYAF
jgi:hypothetical protein